MSKKIYLIEINETNNRDFYLSKKLLSLNLEKRFGQIFVHNLDNYPRLKHYCEKYNLNLSEIDGEDYEHIEKILRESVKSSIAYFVESKNISELESKMDGLNNIKIRVVK